jgi:hypothetical protein
MKTKILIKKISAALLVLASLSLTAIALAPDVPGNLPVVEPLQPLPELIKPNIELNVDRNADDVSTNPAATPPPGSSSAPSAPGTSAEPGQGNVPVVVPTPEIIAMPTPVPMSERGQSILLWVVLGGVLIALVLVFMGVRHHAKNSTKN